jgi:hypothetical protein
MVWGLHPERTSRPALRANHPPTQWIPTFIPRGKEAGT